jgi:hypothetical protein
MNPESLDYQNGFESSRLGLLTGTLRESLIVTLFAAFLALIAFAFDARLNRNPLVRMPRNMHRLTAILTDQFKCCHCLQPFSALPFVLVASWTTLLVLQGSWVAGVDPSH